MGRIFIVVALGFVAVIVMASALHGSTSNVIAAVTAPTPLPSNATAAGASIGSVASGVSKP